MIKNNKININVNKDDGNINDFLYCWSEMGSRPSKNIIYKNFEASEFLEYFNDKIVETTVQKDIIPYDVNDMVNERKFCKIDEQIWISFTIFDSHSDDPFIGEVCFYYNHKYIDGVDLIIDDINKFELKDNLEESELQSNFYSLLIGQSGFELDPISIDPEKFDNIECFYNDGVMNKVNKLSKKLKKSQKGLSIIYGEKGTGKTSIINYLTTKVKNKSFIFIPTTLFDISINNPEFRNFIKKNKNSVLIFDDCEIYFSEIYSKSNIFSNNLLQLVDGVDSDDLNINLLLVLNCEKENDIDEHLLECNNLMDLINIDYLSKEKIKDFCKVFDKKIKIKTPLKLIHILKNKPNFGESPELGFN